MKRTVFKNFSACQHAGSTKAKACLNFGQPKPTDWYQDPYDQEPDNQLPIAITVLGFLALCFIFLN